MIIAIAGGTGSGKTTVAKKIKELYTQESNINVTIISMDNYYKNKHTQVFDNYDHPNAFDIDLLYADLLTYLSTGKIVQRSYDYVLKERSVLAIEKNIHLIILEGLYSFYVKKIRDVCTLTLYLDVDEALRIKRRISRDLEERNISMEENMKMIHGFVNEMYKEHVLKQREMADKVYTNSEDAYLRFLSQRINLEYLSS
jgi:uridine kinase